MILSFHDFGLLCVVFVTNGWGIRMAWKQYLAKGYLPPTIIAHVGLIFYGALPALFMFLAPERSLEIFGRYNLNFTWRILAMFTVTSFGCLAATILVRPGQIQPHLQLNLCKILYIVSGIGALLLLWIYDRTWAQAGGLYGFIFSGESRMEMSQYVFGKSIYSFFNYYVLFKIFFSILCIAIFSEIKVLGKIRLSGYIAIFVSSLFPLVNIIGGTRLIILHAFIIFLASATLFSKLRINLRIVFIFLILFLSLNFIGNKRDILRKCLADQQLYYQALLKDAITLSLIPSESFSGYIPAYIIFASGEKKFIEPQYMKLMPRTVAKFLDLDKKEHFSKMLAIHGKYARNQTVFTVSLPVDAYFGLWRSFIMLAIYSFSVFAIFNWSARYLVRLNSINGWYLYLVLMGLVWVYIRYDVNRSFSRTWQTLLFSAPIIIFFWFRTNMSLIKK